MFKKTALFLLLFICHIFILITLFGAENPQHIDVFLLIDGSGSMNWHDRDPNGLRVQGAKLFVDLCEKGDRIGLIEFSDDAKILFPLFEIISPQDYENLKLKIDEIKAVGKFTDITSALNIAIQRLSKGRSNVRKAVILLTDGEIDPNPASKMFYPFNKKYRKELLAAHNKRKIKKIREEYKKIASDISRKFLEEKVLPLYKENNIPIITIAFGKGADKNLLKHIADFTSVDPFLKNFYFINNASDLQPTFSQIVEQLKGKREKITEKKIEFAGKDITHKVKIDNFVKEVNFKFIFSKKVKKDDINISLKAPDGTIITRDTDIRGVKHTFEEGYELYNIFNPLPGTWEISIKGRKDVKLHITISTWGITKLKILTKGKRSDYLTGDSIPILASLEMNGQKVTTKNFLENPRFIGIIENPQHKIETIELFDDGAHSDKDSNDGTFGNVFTHTNIAGDYSIKIIAKGTTKGMRKSEFTREAEYRIHILPRVRKQATVTAETTKGTKIQESQIESPKQQTKPKKAALKIEKIPYKWIIIAVAIAIIIIIIAALISKHRKKLPTLEEPESEILPEWEITEVKVPPIIKVKIKDGNEKNVSKIIMKKTKNETIGFNNLIIRNEEGKFYALNEEGTLKINGNTITQGMETEIENDDIIQVGNLYFRIELDHQTGKITFIGINKEDVPLLMKNKNENDKEA